MGVLHVLRSLVAATNYTCSLTQLAYSTTKKSHLSKLRRTTGFPFSACRDALLKNNNQYEDALAWLEKESQREGWRKAGKLAGRPLSQGLLGLIETKKCVIIVEANCETDFVARTDHFQNLVAIAAESVLHSLVTDQQKPYWSTDELCELKAAHPSHTTLNSLVASTIGTVGENMLIRRAFGLYNRSEPSHRLASYTHLSTAGVQQTVRDVKFGKYAAAIRYCPKGDQIASSAWHDRAATLGKQLCQHIVGMNPRPGLDVSEPSSDPDEEKCLLLQQFLLDETILVGQHLTRNDMVITDFVRVECGFADETSSKAGEIHQHKASVE